MRAFLISAMASPLVKPALVKLNRTMKLAEASRLKSGDSRAVTMAHTPVALLGELPLKRRHFGRSWIASDTRQKSL